jgi:hypothetical protein
MGSKRRFQPARPEQLAPGVRVRLRGRGASFTLAADTGTVVGPDPLAEGYYIIRLDAPATYYRADGATEPLEEIREADDNLMVLEAAPVPAERAIRQAQRG